MICIKTETKEICEIDDEPKQSIPRTLLLWVFKSREIKQFERTVGMNKDDREKYFRQLWIKNQITVQI